MAQIETVYVHEARWESDVDPRTMAVWTAHRPLRGEAMWEGSNVAYGCHFAAAPLDHERFEFFEESNRRDDARRVVLVDNMAALALAGEACKAKGAEAYGLGAYVLAYLDPEDGGPREGARTFLHVHGLPWDDADTSADALLAALATA